MFPQAQPSTCGLGISLLLLCTFTFLPCVPASGFTRLRVGDSLRFARPSMRGTVSVEYSTFLPVFAWADAHWSAYAMFGFVCEIFSQLSVPKEVELFHWQMHLHSSINFYFSYVSLLANLRKKVEIENLWVIL